MISTFPKMCVDAHISGRSRQTLVFPVLNVFPRLRIDVFLGQAKVNNVHYVLAGGVVSPHQEVLWLHVPIYQMLVMHILNSGYLRVVVVIKDGEMELLMELLKKQGRGKGEGGEGRGGGGGRRGGGEGRGGERRKEGHLKAIQCLTKCGHYVHLVGFYPPDTNSTINRKMFYIYHNLPKSADPFESHYS